MDDSIRKSLIWKERQILTPVWLVFAGLFLVMLLVVSVTAPTSNPVYASTNYCSLMYLIVCTVGLAIGIILFSPEREQGTDLLLGSFPTTDRLVASVKFREGSKYFVSFFLFVGLITALVFLAVFRTPIFLTGILGVDAGIAGAVVALLVPVECFLWALICSLRFSKSLYAILAAAVLSVLGVLLASLSSDLLGLNLSNDSYPIAMLIAHVALILILVATTHWLGRDWLRGGIKLHAESGPSSVASAWSQVRARWFHRGPSPAYPWQSLGWQLWRTHRWVIGLSIVACFVFVLACQSLLFATYSRPLMLTTSIEGFASVILVFAAVLGAVVGMSTFAVDQMGRRFRFFQQQADYPIRIWASRLATILVIVPFLWWATSWLISNEMEAYANEFNNNSYNWRLRHLLQGDAFVSASRCVFVYLAVAAIAQLMSILIRSGMIMVIAATAVCTLASMWFLYLNWLGVSLLTFGWPIVISCVLASAWYAPQWIRGRSMVRGMVGSSVLVVSVSLLSVMGLRYQRLHDVPEQASFAELDQLFDHQDQVIRDNPKKYGAALALRNAIGQSTPLVDAMETVGIEEMPFPIVQANDISKWPDTVLKQFITDNRESIDMAVEAVQDPNSRYAINLSSEKEAGFQRTTVRRLLAAESYYQLEQGEIEGAKQAIRSQILAARYLGTGTIHRALQNLVRWSELDGQTPESIQAGLVMLDEIEVAVFDRDSNITMEAAYYGHRRNYSSWVNDEPLASGWAYRQDTNFLPSWEVIRSRRLFQEQLRNHQYTWGRICSNVEKQVSMRSFAFRMGQRYETPMTWLELSVPLDRSYVSFGSVTDLAYSLIEADAISYTRIRLSLSGFHAQFGRYPDQLSELEGKFLDRIPVDTETGASFAYSGSGVDLPVISTNVDLTWINGYSGVPINYEYALTVDDVLPANRPFLLPWSGIINQKREFRFVPPSAETEIESGEPTNAALELGYWLPRQTGSQFRRESFYRMEDLILGGSE